MGTRKKLVCKPKVDQAKDVLSTHVTGKDISTLAIFNLRFIIENSLTTAWPVIPRLVTLIT